MRLRRETGDFNITTSSTGFNSIRKGLGVQDLIGEIIYGKSEIPDDSENAEEGATVEYEFAAVVIEAAKISGDGYIGLMSSTSSGNLIPCYYFPETGAISQVPEDVPDAAEALSPDDLGGFTPVSGGGSGENPGTGESV